MKKNIGKRLQSIALAALLLVPTTVFAAPQDLSFGSITAEENLVEIKVKNQLEEETLFTITVLKDDVTLAERDKVYALLQKMVKAGEETSFFVLIPDEKRGVSGTGSYVVEARNSGDGYAKTTFMHASKRGIQDFADMLKSAASGVTDGSQAYLALLPVIQDPAHEPVLFTIGMDYVAFGTETSAIQQNAMNLLYQCGMSNMTAEEIGRAVSLSYGVALYNSGDKTKAGTKMNLKYNGEKADTSYISSAFGKMDATYAKVSDFEKAFADAYGLVMVENATVDGMEDMLKAYVTETGEASAEVSAIENLLPIRKYKAYEYMVLQLNNTTLMNNIQLETLLSAAYQAAVNDGAPSGGGGGGGGSISGGVSNKAEVNGGSVSAPVGSGTNEQKVDTGKRIFADLPVGHWAEKSIKVLKEKGIVSGTPDGAYEPERAVTREEFTKMLVLACGFATTGSNVDFTDVQTDAWYASYISTAVENGLVNGIGNNQFGVGQKISRQDMAVMTARALEKKGIALEQLKEYIDFSDQGKIADYAEASIRTLFESGIVNGKGNNAYDPVGTATRAEVAKIIYEAFQGGK